jgi:Mce-associated membrane protein
VLDAGAGEAPGGPTEADVPATATTAGDPPASWPTRAGAFTVDVLLGGAVIATLALLALTAERFGWTWWLLVVCAALTLVAVILNRSLVPALTGWSVGRAYFGIAVHGRDGSKPGAVHLVLRDLAHLLDTAAVFVGWFWPLWDRRHRTFADLLTRTEVVRVGRPERDVRRPVLIACAAAVVISALAIGLCYLTVYRPERAVDTARSQIAEQGPRIVERLLTYDTETLQQDFSNAQALVTDSYRDQLIAQQQAVLKAGPVGNEYWAVSSAVLPGVTANKAAMLLAMQGQRGTDPKTLKFITATVRADFDRTADGQWKVATLSVLKKPQMSGGGQ